MESMLQETEAYIRKSISEEQLAIAVYLERKQLSENYANQCREKGNEELAKKFDVLAHTLEDIMQEEELHVGQFREMLDLFDVSDTQEDKGEDEAKEDTESIIGESFVSVSKRLAKYIQCDL